MKAAHKIEASTTDTHNNLHLKNLLLNPAYKSQHKAAESKSPAQQLDSRIEAEYQMEAVFRSLF